MRSLFVPTLIVNLNLGDRFLADEILLIGKYRLCVVHIVHIWHTGYGLMVDLGKFISNLVINPFYILEYIILFLL